MAISNVRLIGSGANTAVGPTVSSVVITLSGAAAIGEAVTVVAFSRAQHQPGCADSKGNTWSANVRNLGNAFLWTFTAILTNALANGDTITLSDPALTSALEGFVIAAAGVDPASPIGTTGSGYHLTATGNNDQASLNASSGTSVSPSNNLVIVAFWESSLQASGNITATLTAGYTQLGSLQTRPGTGYAEVFTVGTQLFTTNGPWTAGGTGSLNGATLATAVLVLKAADVAPNAPTLTAHAAFDRHAASDFLWTFSDPDTGDTQSAYELLITKHSDGTTAYDSGKVTSTVAKHTLAANTLPAGGIQYDWTVKTWDSHNVAGPYAATSAVTPYSSPDAPTLVPTGDFNIAQSHAVGWTYNDPDAGNTQSAYELRITRVADGVLVYDSGKVTSTAGSYTLPAHTLPSGARYSWTVRTWDQHAAAGPYATALQFTASGPPTAAVTTPTAAQVATAAALTAHWLYSGLLAQGGYQVRLWKAAVLVYNSGELLGAATALALPALDDASSYQLGLTVWDTTGTPGPETLVSFSTSFVATPEPYVFVEPTADGGGVRVRLSAPPPGGGQVAAGHFELWRSEDGGLTWRRIAANLAPQ